MQGAGLASVTSLRLRQGRPSFLLSASFPPPIHVALTTASSLAACGWGRDHARLCRSPAGLHGSLHPRRARRGSARARVRHRPNRRVRRLRKAAWSNLPQSHRQQIHAFSGPARPGAISEHLLFCKGGVGSEKRKI
jgi:hypothetical protein